jgi:predicted transcriptional regulator
MACVANDGSLTEQAKRMLHLLDSGCSLEEAAAAADLPLFRIRGSVRELVEAGLVEATGAIYRTTAEGRAKLASQP